MISKMPLVFTWRRRDGIAKAVYERYLTHAEEGWRSCLQRIRLREPQASDSLSREFDGLPRASQLRFLTAPQTYRLMNRTGSGTLRRQVAFISESLRAEKYLLNPEEPRCAHAWTALGDHFFPVKGEGLEQDYAAPLIMESVVIDAFSPYSEVAIPGGDGFKPAHPPDELSQIIGRLYEAANGIDELSPLVIDLIVIVTKVIALKRDLDAPESFGSSSWSSTIGKMALTNAHARNVGAAQIANALVHEAIHSLLYMVEIENSFYHDEARVCDVKVNSPWTGRTLYLSSFLHACFVWFGLACFWQMAESRQVFPQEETVSCLRRALAGFHEGSLLEMLSEAAPYLKTELLDAIQTMQRTLGGVA